jgi:hypothetical protein
MTDADRFLVIREAVYQMAKVLRKYPPMEMDWFYEDMQRLSILAGGTERDPEGKEWVNYFLNSAYQELREKGVVTPHDETMG